MKRKRLPMHAFSTLEPGTQFRYRGEWWVKTPKQFSFNGSDCNAAQYTGCDGAWQLTAGIQVDTPCLVQYDPSAQKVEFA